MLTGADDTYLLDPPEIAFPEVKLHEARLRTIGLELSYPKMKCYIADEHHNDAYYQERTSSGIDEGTIKDENGNTLYSLNYSVPIGSDEYISHWLEQKSKKIISNLREISELLDPNAIAPAEIPTRQCLYLLTLICLQFKGNYFVEHIPHNSLNRFAIRLTLKPTN